jgi:hypothetical protein
MFPEDRVFVGVINRQRDLNYARAGWYRIPLARMPDGMDAEYVAFFLSRAFGARNGGIYYYAARRGVELVYRRDLLPSEPNHPRAGEVYYKVQLGALVEKSPPVLNASRRTVAFLSTTWDRFVNARQLSDLHCPREYYVDRIYR